MDQRRIEFLKNRQAKWIKRQPEAEPLIKLIEDSYDGSIVVPPPGDREDQMEKITKKSGFFDPVDYTVSILQMQASRCHQNSSIRWLEHIDENKEITQHVSEDGKITMKGPLKWFISTGYALYQDDDGGKVWRQHTWVINKEDKIIEDPGQTEVLSYFGIVMDVDESAIFAINQL